MQIIMMKPEQDVYLKKERYCIKEEKKQLSVVLQIQNKITDIDMHNNRGKAKVQSYAWLSCCVQNMKTIALREV